MAYKITLKIEGKKEEFTRKSSPNLHDVTMAMKANVAQENIANKDLSSDERVKNIDKYEKALAEFASAFWGKEFSFEDAINGSSIESVKAINRAYINCLVLEDEEDSDTKKK